jgi:hypothetical protein
MEKISITRREKTLTVYRRTWSTCKEINVIDGEEDRVYLEEGVV